MPLVGIVCFLLFAGCSSSKTPGPNKTYKIGLCVFATGHYNDYAQELIASARKFFCKEHQVTYFVFTDGEIPQAEDVIVIYQKQLGWPYDSLKRFHVYDSNKTLLSKMDYLFAIDADMRFFEPVGTEVLGKTVAVARDVGSPRTYERNKKSKAYLSSNQARHYFVSAFFGGVRAEFFRMIGEMKKQVDSDLMWDYIAQYHAESHLNRYFHDNPPRIVLDTSYCYPQGWDLPFPKKIVAMIESQIQLPISEP